MRLPVPLQDVRALFVIDVADGQARVGRDAFAAQPGGVGGAEGVGGQGGEIGGG